MISLLLTCRKDSKFLSKFLLTFMVNTYDFNNVELLILTPKGEWNRELLEYFKDKIQVFDDNTGLGRGGSHVYYQTLSEKAKGDWMWYLCDDHYLLPNYDKHMTDFLNLLDPSKVNVVAPFVDNSGRISHILSRKFVETVGFAPQGNVDSCINDTLEELDRLFPDRAILHLPGEPVMHDFSLDKDLFKAPPFDGLKEAALFRSKPVRNKIANNARKLYEEVKKE